MVKNIKCLKIQSPKKSHKETFWSKNIFGLKRVGVKNIMRPKLGIYAAMVNDCKNQWFLGGKEIFSFLFWSFSSKSLYLFSPRIVTLGAYMLIVYSVEKTRQFLLMKKNFSQDCLTSLQLLLRSTYQVLRHAEKLGCLNQKQFCRYNTE